MLYFATLFDYNYLGRGLCLLDSLNETIPGDFTLYVLALDNETFEHLSKPTYNNVVVITINDIENYYPELIEAKANRNKVEYYFTLSPILPLYILENYDSDRITSLDADLYFYADPTVIFDNYQPDDILITPHDFSSNLKHLKEYGYYNVSFQSFPRTANSFKVLNDWKVKCISWCHDILDPSTGAFADQKYLDSWKDSFTNVQDIELKTCGRAPWNIEDTEISIKRGKILIINRPLVYYHFHHLRIYGKIIEHGLAAYRVSEITAEIKIIYRRYLKKLMSYNKILYSVNDKSISRNNSSQEKSSFFNHIWEIESGALKLGGAPYFFNIRFIKRLYYYINRKLIT